MPKFIDLTGQRFGSLVVLERAENNKHNRIQWRVRCDCGNIRVIPGNHLKEGWNKFCKRGGHSRIGDGVAAFNVFYNYTRKNSIKRGYEWHLSKQDVLEISQKNCHYCNAPPSQIVKSSTTHTIGDFIYTGIDRVDNKIGYTKDNCVPCCGKCNTMKMDMSIIDFANQVINIFKHWIPKILND